MSILIKGFDMPIDYGRCMVIFPDGRVTTEFGSMVIGHAIEVPPHGRLIDADALDTGKMIDVYISGELYRHEWNIDEWLNTAPTIIPAEEADKPK